MLAFCLFCVCVCYVSCRRARWKRGRLTRCRCECTRYVNSSILYSVYDASAHERSEKYIAFMGVRARPERRGRRETARLWLCAPLMRVTLTDSTSRTRNAALSGRLGGCLSSVWYQAACEMLNIRSGGFHTGVNSIKESTRALGCRQAALHENNRYILTEAHHRVTPSIGRLSDHPMVPANMCDA